MYISNQVRRGIKIACINADISVVGACKKAGVSKSTIYRFMQGNNDISMLKLDTLFRLGLDSTFQDILELGEGKK